MRKYTAHNSSPSASVVAAHPPVQRQPHRHRRPPWEQLLHRRHRRRSAAAAGAASATCGAPPGLPSPASPAGLNNDSFQVSSRFRSEQPTETSGRRHCHSRMSSSSSHCDSRLNESVAQITSKFSQIDGTEKQSCAPAAVPPAARAAPPCRLQAPAAGSRRSPTQPFPRHPPPSALPMWPPAVPPRLPPDARSLTAPPPAPPQLRRSGQQRTLQRIRLGCPSRQPRC